MHDFASLSFVPLTAGDIIYWKKFQLEEISIGTIGYTFLLLPKIFFIFFFKNFERKKSIFYRQLYE